MGNCALHRHRPACRNSTKLFLLLRTIFVLLSCISVSQAQNTKAMIYLASYGYLPPTIKNPSSGKILSPELFTKAIKEFQSFAGLNVTGEMNEETLQLMDAPRCGVTDRVGYGLGGRSKRYALQGSRWRVKDLTYKISKYPRRLLKNDTDREVKRAFAVWSSYTDLTFTQKRSGSVHIEIAFEKGEHGDGDPFDGPGGTLAHAYFPIYGGDAHFDDDEVWTVDSHRGTNLFQVAAHEFGHSLGLSHSDIKSALMAPFYRGYQPYFELDEDDVQGIQQLYGKKSSGRVTTPRDPPGRRTTESPNSIGDDLELCKNGAADTMFKSPTGSGPEAIYVFKGDKYWQLEDDGVVAGYPKLIQSRWPGLPSNIDAAFTYLNNKTYFFKGRQYWRYVMNKMDGEYPKLISQGFQDIPDNIDAAMVWGGNGKIYFFKGDKFWRFDPHSKPPVKDTYPKPLTNWEGVPNGIDAALQYINGYTYFFKKGAYWRFNDRSFTVDAASPSFPRATAYWWYGCKDATKGTLGNLSGDYKSTPQANEDDGSDWASSEHNDDHDVTVDGLILDAATTEALPEPDANGNPIPEERNESGQSTASSVSQTQLLFISLILLQVFKQ